MKTTVLLLSISILLTVGCSETPKSQNNLLVSLDSLEVEISEIHLCTELVDPDFNEMDYMDAISDKYIEVVEKVDTTKGVLKTEERDRKPAASGLKFYLWPTGSTLKVQFLDGTPSVIEKVKEYAKGWESHANIKFLFGTFPNPDITISFKADNGSWSYIGVQSKKFRPSMNYGWLKESTNDEEYSRVVLHEFGHALGLIHEHQVANGNPIKWDTKKTYWYYKTSQGWDTDKVDRNIFEKYNNNQLMGSSFDPKSIMLYSIPRQLTLDGFSTMNNNFLSDTDKEQIKLMYK